MALDKNDPRVSYSMKELLIGVDDKIDKLHTRIDNLEGRTRALENRMYAVGVIAGAAVLLVSVVAWGAIPLGAILAII